MNLSRLANLIDLLTPQRAVVYAVSTMAIGCLVIFFDFARAPQEISGSVDFPAFYNAGRILNEYPRGSLYDRDLQHKLYLEIAPASSENRYFAYTPFFAILFIPLALLPHSIAFICWVVISLGLFAAGFWLTWSAADLPVRFRTRSFLIGLSFLPFFAWCVLAGQVSAFGFFWLAAAVYLDKKKPTASGFALAMLLYKPPLLILVVPMLVVTRRWRTLVGFTISSALLILISIAVIGLDGVWSYLEMLRTFSQTKAVGKATRLEIDLFSFFSSFVGGRLATYATLCFALVLAPLLLSAWRRMPETAWALAITWTLVLNFYMLIYDTTFIILSVLFFISAFDLSRLLRWLLLALFLVPWPEIAIVRRFGLQVMTIVLAAFGVYQLAKIRGRARDMSDHLPHDAGANN